MTTSSDLHVTSSALRPVPLTVSGYKHAAVGLIAASIALNRPVVLSNVPDIEDVAVLCQIIRDGGGLAQLDAGVLHIDTREFRPPVIPESLSRRVHGVLYLLPVLLGRFGAVRLRESGGCALDGSGAGPQRPVHHMLSVLERFGARVESRDHVIDGTAGGFHACEIDFMDYSDRADVLTGPLVSGATKTAILAAACVRDGETRIRNFYRKPDVTELLAFLLKAGFDVRVDGDDVTVSRCAASDRHPVRHHLVSCLSEVMTYIALAQHCRVPLTLRGLTTERLRSGLAAELSLLNAMDVPLEWRDSELVVGPARRLRATDIEVTSAGIYSDHQPFFALMLLRADGPSHIRELVWKKRFSYANELNRLGARIVQDQNAIVVTPSSLAETGQTVVADDLRAAAVLTVAALGIPGTTIVRNAHHLARGYPDLPSALQRLGARVEWLPPDHLVSAEHAAPSTA
ncbi:hypothetical protein [Burkholderia diffusa]|uniref:hypothetical protein n=1 Tax=Burkholderia diffusa TaxID=488732 RepID=UPI00157B5444|nr:hypothetical protein [Burkholderia diffusa]NTY37434.1 hypothetical protein [Burkholderia diffusa]